MSDNKNKKTVFGSKFKYGASAIVFTLVFIVFIIILNVALSVIEDKTGSLTFDVTNGEIFSVSDKSVTALSDIDKKVQIIFCQPEDKIVSDEYLNYAKILSDNYANRFDNVEVTYKDLVSNPSYFVQFKSSGLDVVTGDSVIIYCENTKLYKIINARQMTVSRYDEYGNAVPYIFTGEDKITTAILSVARNDTAAYRAGIISGHGEDTNHNIVHFLEQYGYEVTNPLDLKTTSQLALSDYDLLIINNPQSDYYGDESPAINETMKLTQFVQKDFGSVMIFMNPYTGGSTPNFDEFLDIFGVAVEKTPISDYKEGNRSGLAADASFFGSYSKFTPDIDGMDYGYDIHKPVSESGSGLRPLFSASCFISVKENKVKNLRVYPIVLTSEDGTVFVDENTDRENPGSVPVITVSEYSKLIAGDDEYTSHVILCGSTGFIDQLGNNAVANTDLFRCMLVATGNDTIVTDIDYKFFDDHSIMVDEKTVNESIWKLAVLVPAIISVLGIAVFVMRKYFL